MNQAASSVWITGPLLPYADGCRRYLQKIGYAPTSVVGQLRVAAHLSRWMERRSTSLATLSPALVGRFLHERRRAGYTEFLTRWRLRPIIAFLAAEGVIPDPGMDRAIDQRPRLPILQRYVEYLAKERGLAATSIRSYEDVVRRFLDAQPDLRKLSAGKVSSFIIEESKRYAVGTVKVMVSVLRSFLRYLHCSGELSHDLAGAVPAVAGWRLAGVPQALPAEDVAQILQSCDRTAVVGRRDYAILLLLTRLGLRRGEVATLEMDDIHWAEGELVIHGKGSAVESLPLPKDVGGALVAYLRVRGRRPSRRVFVSVRAPYGALTPLAVSAIVRAACVRAGLAPVGPHRLRHTIATNMLFHGASLTEIAHVLRHRHLDTTAIYAKVDTSRLRMVARPWPAGSR